MLGGSGSHNQMVYMRGSPRDWDGYAALVGDDGYNYTNILRHYKNTERFVGTVLNDIEGKLNNLLFIKMSVLQINLP